MNLKKDFYIGIFLTLLLNFSFAQRENACIPILVNTIQNIKTPTDTLKPASFSTGTPTLYKYVQGGYSFGTNVLSDKAFAQVYNVDTSYFIEGIALWFGAKEQTGNTDTVNIVLYELCGPGTATTGTVNNAPDTAKKIIKILVNQIDTTNLTIVNFNTPFIVYTDFAAGVDFSQIIDDTLGLITTHDSDAVGTELSWNKWSDGTWHTILEPFNWGMALDLGIFIIADMSSANINDNYFIDGIKLSQNNPNPANNTTVIQYEIQNSGNVVLEIYDITGKLVQYYNQGLQLAGQHSIVVNTSNLNSGTYYYSLKSDSRRLIKKMLIYF